MIIFELLQLFNYSDNIQYALCISYSSEFSVNDFIIVWSFIQYVSSVICFLRQDVFARILLAEKFLSSRATLYWYLDKKTKPKENTPVTYFTYCKRKLPPNNSDRQGRSRTVCPLGYKLKRKSNKKINKTSFKNQ